MLPAQLGDYLCVFCHRDTDLVYYGENNEHVIGRKEIVEEYKIFMKKLKESPNVAKALAEESKEESGLIKVFK
jgi:wyosine [tRNA(Phe)-imidazoG37] synthetase (radical SAM superfamily)